MKLGRLSQIPIPKKTILFVGTIACYWILWPYATDWTGKWPAPYWFSIGFGVILIHGLMSDKWRQQVWALPFACLGVFLGWFFELGVYQTWLRDVILHDYRWYHRSFWPEKLPVVLLVVGTFAVLSGRRPVSFALRLGAIALVAALFCSLLYVSNFVCSFALPRAGTSFHGNYDVFGFRLGLYFLMTITVCVGLLNYLLSISPKRPHEESV